MSITQTPTLLPPPPDSTLTPAQWGIFSAIANTVVPSISHVGGNRLLQLPVRPHVYESSINRVRDLAGDGAGDDSSVAAAYLAESAAAEPQFQQCIFRYIAESMPEETRKGLLFILNALKCVPSLPPPHPQLILDHLHHPKQIRVMSCRSPPSLYEPQPAHPNNRVGIIS